MGAYCMSVFRERLQALYQNKQSEVSERDVLRISGLVGRETTDSFEQSKLEILKWVKNRAGGILPAASENFLDFSVDVGGRNVECRAEDFGDIKMWGLRAEDPDKNVAGRVWKTEVVLAQPSDGHPMLSIRLRVTNRGFDDNFIPSSPGVVQQLIENIGLRRDNLEFSSKTIYINDEDSFEEFVEYLTDETRQLPIVLLSQIPSKSFYSISPLELLKRVSGMAHVYCISDAFTWKMSDRVGRKNSVFDGGIKVYNPSSNSDLDVLDFSSQRLLTRNYIESTSNKNTPIRLIVGGICEQSLNSQRLGREIIAFSEFSSKLQKHRIAKLSNQNAELGGKTTEVVQALKEQVSSLEYELLEKSQMEAFALDENEELRKRAEEAERQQNLLLYRLKAIENSSDDALVSENVDSPNNWQALVEWVESRFTGKIVLTPSARRGAKKAKYEDLSKVVSSFKWLATRGIEGRTSNVGETLKEEYITDGVLHAHCGGDTYDFDWQNNRFQADWHIKSGGNTHDPKRCLRIYYSWDPQSSQIVVSDMPSHVKTEAS